MAKKKEEEVIMNEEETEACGDELCEEVCEPDEKEKELAALNDKYLRLVAEYDNYRKRTAKEKESIYPEAKVSAAAAFLPVMDNIERALAEERENDSLYEGVKMIKKQFEDALKNIGIEPIEAVGCSFDPNFHNAVMHIDDENYGENEIVEEFQKGYKMGERIVRYSMVKVAN